MTEETACDSNTDENSSLIPLQLIDIRKFSTQIPVLSS